MYDKLMLLTPKRKENVIIQDHYYKVFLINSDFIPDSEV